MVTSESRSAWAEDPAQGHASASAMAAYLAPRQCFLMPIPGLDRAADLLAGAADALLAGKLDVARDLVGKANDPVLMAYASRIMGKEDPSVHRYRRIAATRPSLIVKASQRMPSAADRQTMYVRDGWRCRFCGCRIVLDTARRAMRQKLPGVIPWSKAEGFHAAFYALSGSVDHVIPHAHGGGNELDNIVTACWPCQFGRGDRLVEEVGLIDPRSRAPVIGLWDGLTRMLQSNGRRMTTRQSSLPAARPDRVSPRDGNMPSSNATRPRGSLEDGWLAALNADVRESARRMGNFLDECEDLDVSWSIKKIMLARMKVGGACVEFFGVQPNGRVEIPWSAGGRKDVLKSFAKTVADAIPGAVCYETPKTWTVAMPQKQRVHVANLLTALPAIRVALTEMSRALRNRHA